jgi:hypothetical protein
MQENVITESVPAAQPLGSLAAALAAAQGEIEGAKKDSENPFFKSSYADLASVWDACRAPLVKNGLAIIQLVKGGPDTVTIETILAHKSGERIGSELTLRPKATDPQGIGSAITYGRRYALAAMVGVCPVDDDGEAAMGRTAPKAPQSPRSPAPGTDEPFPDKPAYEQPLANPAPSAAQPIPASGADVAPTCELCNKPMKKRTGARGSFWGCTGYPNCTSIRSI